MHDSQSAWRRDDRRALPASLAAMLRASDGILELLPVATFICDAYGRILQYNQKAVEVWGRSPEPEETHEKFTAACRFFAIDGGPLPRSMLAEVLRTGEPVRGHELLVERADGLRIAVLVNIDPLKDPHGRMIGVVNCFQDITESKRIHAELDRSERSLREQEQRLAATYEHAAIGIAETDAEGKLIRVNEATCAITGFSREELLGATVMTHTHPSDRSTDEDAYRRQVAGEVGTYSLEKRIVRRDGSMVWVSMRSSAVCDPDGRFLYGVRVIQDINERKEAEERQKLLIDELNHRVKNTLATVQSLAWHTARGTGAGELFRKALEGRLIALSEAHDQLTVRRWEHADLQDIVKAAMGPYLTRGQEQIAIAGPSVTLRPRVALTLAMVFHELATNAAKYGALSCEGGRVEIAWSLDRDQPDSRPRLRMRWRERGGPPVAPPTRRGFGSKLIEASVGTELEGSAQLSYDPAGLSCVMQLPLGAPVVRVPAG